LLIRYFAQMQNSYFRAVCQPPPRINARRGTISG
jgi:hypothetical protein